MNGVLSIVTLTKSWGPVKANDWVPLKWSYTPPVGWRAVGIVGFNDGFSTIHVTRCYFGYETSGDLATTANTVVFEGHAKGATTKANTVSVQLLICRDWLIAES